MRVWQRQNDLNFASSFRIFATDFRRLQNSTDILGFLLPRKIDSLGERGSLSTVSASMRRKQKKEEA